MNKLPLKKIVLPRDLFVISPTNDSFKLKKEEVEALSILSRMILDHTGKYGQLLAEKKEYEFVTELITKDTLKLFEVNHQLSTIYRILRDLMEIPLTFTNTHGENEVTNFFTRIEHDTKQSIIYVTMRADIGYMLSTYHSISINTK